MDDEAGMEMSRRRILGSASWATIQQMVTLGVTALSSVLLARSLSVADFGVFSYATNLAAMGTMIVGAGLSSLAVKALVSDRGAERATMTSLILIREAFALLAYVLLIAVAMTSGSAQSISATAIASLVLFARGFDATEIWFQSYAQSGKTAPIRIAVVLVMLAVRVLFVISGASLMAFLFLYVAEAIFITAGLLTRYFLDRKSPGFGRLRLSLPTQLLGQSWILLLSGIAAQVNTRGTVLVVQALMGSAAVGVYSAAARLSEIFYFLPVVFMTATFPRLLHIRQRHGPRSAAYRAELQRSYDQAFWVGVAIAVAMFFAGPALLDFFFGDRYAAAGKVLQIHIAALPFVFLAAVFSKWIVAENLLVASLIRHAFGAVLNIVLSFLLIPDLGLAGGAVASVVSYISASYVACFFTKSTRGAGVQMTLAIFLPFRLLNRAWIRITRRPE